MSTAAQGSAGVLSLHPPSTQHTHLLPALTAGFREDSGRRVAPAPRPLCKGTTALCSSRVSVNPGRSPGPASELPSGRSLSVLPPYSRARHATAMAQGSGGGGRGGCWRHHIDLPSPAAKLMPASASGLPLQHLLPGTVSGCCVLGPSTSTSTQLAQCLCPQDVSLPRASGKDLLGGSGTSAVWGLSTPTP